MSDASLELAEKYLAEGDYVQALAELGKAAPLDPQISRVIHQALERMKLIAAREFAVGRWSVAEGIFDAVEEHAQFLSPAERTECKMLVKEIQRCRDSEKQVHGVLQAAAQLAAEGHYPRSREVALRAMRRCDDLHLVARLRRLLMGLPHPLGRLIYGFDSALELEQFVRPTGQASIDPVVDESHEVGGGFAWLRVPERGGGIALLDPPPDWSDSKELSFLVRRNCNVFHPTSMARMRLAVWVGELQDAWVYEGAVPDQGWHQFRIPLGDFRARGNPSWGRVTRFSILSDSDGPLDFFIDEIRLKPRPPAAPPGPSVSGAPRTS